MKTVTLQLPDTLDMGDMEIKRMLAGRLYEAGKLTLGQAAELAGYTKETFMELLSDQGISLFQQSDDELNEDIKNALGHSL